VILTFARCTSSTASRARAQASQGSVECNVDCSFNPSSSAEMRISQRDGTVGTPLIFWARVRYTRSAPSSDMKSWAARPVSSSGDGKPSSCRIGRLSHAPVSAASGHVPSLSEPRIMTSGCCRRASNGPQIATRGCTGVRSRTFSRANRLL